jgi:tRNA G10  N-methylase Trm11
MSSTVDPFADLKTRQRAMWASFAPTAAFTTPVAAHLVEFAEIKLGEIVLDVGTGTGVVAITAARAGASVTGLDLTPDLLDVARENAQVASLGQFNGLRETPRVCLCLMRSLMSSLANSVTCLRPDLMSPSRKCAVC